MNKIIVATHQPNYIPWLGYFYKISNCDIFVFLDDVQFSKTGAHNYHFIKTPNGFSKLKIPVKHKYTDPICKVVTNDEGGWKMRHLNDIANNYKESTFFQQIFPDFRNILMTDYASLSSLNISIVNFFLEKLGIKTKTIKSSELDMEVGIRGEERILEICMKLGATTYYSGRGAMAYQKNENFEQKGIKLIYDDFSPVEYFQLWGEFQSNVSIIDYVMNCGYDWHSIKQLIERS